MVGQGGGRDPGRGPQRQRQRLEPPRRVVEHLLAGHGRGVGVHQGDVAVRGAHVPPPPTLPVRVGRRADAPVVALVPVEPVVAAPVSWSGPVGDLLPPVAGPGEDPVGRLVPSGLHVVVGVSVGVPAERGPRLDGERVGAHVRRRVVETEHVGQAPLPVLVPLAGPAQDQVHVPRRQAGPGHRGGGVGHLGRAVAPPESHQHVVDGGLHPERDAGDPARPVGGEQARGHVLGVALDGHLGAGRPWHRVEHLDQQVGGQAGRGAPAEEHRGGVGQALALDRPADLGDARRRVALHQVVPVGVRGEGAVVAPVPAERHVDVDAEGVGRTRGPVRSGHASTAAADTRASSHRASASRRSAAWSTIGSG